MGRFTKKIAVLVAVLFLADFGSGQVLKARSRGRGDDDDDSSSSSSSSQETSPKPVKVSFGIGSDRPQRYQSLGGPNSANGDHSPSAQNGFASIASNPYLLNGQGGGGAGGLLNNPSLYQTTGALGLGLAGNQAGIQNPYLSNQFQNPLAQQALLQQQLLLQQQQQQQQGGLGQFGGLGGFSGLGGVGGLGGGGLYNQQDLYSAGGLGGGAGLGGYNNPYLGLQGGNFGAAGGLGGFGGLGAAAGVNPYLLGRSGYQLGGGNYLAQSLLSPYNAFNPYNQFPFSARFGIGRSSSRANSGSSSSSSNNDE